MFAVLSKIVLSMALLRMISGGIEFTAGLLMLKFNNIEKAMLINSGLAVIGPVVLITTTTLGLIGLADKISPTRFLWIFCGVCCIFIGILKK